MTSLPWGEPMIVSPGIAAQRRSLWLAQTRSSREGRAPASVATSVALRARVTLVAPVESVSCEAPITLAPTAGLAAPVSAAYSVTLTGNGFPALALAGALRESSGSVGWQAKGGFGSQ